MTDTILIRGLRARCIVGDEEWERTTPQEVCFDLELAYDARRAGATDTLAHAVDYAKVSAAVLAYVRESRFHLVEALADGVARLCLATFPITAATVELLKPIPVPGVDHCGIRLTRPTRTA